MKLSLTRSVILAVALASLAGCDSEKEISSIDVEYRKNKEGKLILYEISKEEALTCTLVQDHPNGHRRFEIRFSNGIRDGNFTFWRENETTLSKGEYKNGVRHGKFTAYGGAGELISEKTYANGKLNGPCNFYYRYSNDEVERFFEELEENDLESGELKAQSVLRYTCKFVDDAPSGEYNSYFYEGEEANSASPLLRERGFFDTNGSLYGDQIRYFPKVKTLAIKLPNGQLMDEGYEADVKGLSLAMESAYKAIEELPAYRNREDQPAKIFALDERGNEIVPIWSTKIFEIVIRDLNGSFLEKRYDHTFEDYETAKQRAEFLHDDHGIAAVESSEESLDLHEVRSINRRKTTPAIEVLAINKNGKVIDVLWTSDPDSHVIALHERITKERECVNRAWLDGKSWGARWFLPDGSKLSILDERRREITRTDKETSTSSEKKNEVHSLLP
jgi:antitoxin component YwqK of YwqJK toxin-antitoxin module